MCDCSDCHYEEFCENGTVCRWDGKLVEEDDRCHKKAEEKKKYIAKNTKN